MRQLKSFVILGMLLFFAGDLCAQQKDLAKEKFNWGRDQDTTAGYAQAVRAGNILYISGTVSRDLSEAGIRRAYTALQMTLEHYGLNFQHVVKENLYTTDIETMKKMNYVRKPFYKGDFPAATWVQISRLYMEGAMLEVELVAHFPE